MSLLRRLPDAVEIVTYADGGSDALGRPVPGVETRRLVSGLLRLDDSGEVHRSDDVEVERWSLIVARDVDVPDDAEIYAYGKRFEVQGTADANRPLSRSRIGHTKVLLRYVGAAS